MAARAKAAPSTKPPKRNYNRKPKPPAPPTVDSLLSLVAEAMQAVDTAMAKRKGDMAWVRHMGSREPLYAAEQAVRHVEKHLPELITDEQSMADYLRLRFKTEPGAPLSWSRPGSFLIWMGDIPVRAEWGGFLLRDANTLFALDRKRLFTTPGGSASVQWFDIPATVETPEALLRAKLVNMVQAVKWDNRGKTLPTQMHLLVPPARAWADSFLAQSENAYWREAIKGSPVDAIPIPSNIKPVTPKLFG